MAALPRQTQRQDLDRIGLQYHDERPDRRHYKSDDAGEPQERGIGLGKARDPICDGLGNPDQKIDQATFHRSNDDALHGEANLAHRLAILEQRLNLRRREDDSLLPELVELLSVLRQKRDQVARIGGNRLHVELDLLLPRTGLDKRVVIELQAVLAR